MVTMFLEGGMLISTLMPQAQLEQNRYQWAVQEPYDGNCQQLHFVTYCIQKVIWNALYNSYRLWEIRHTVSLLSGRSNQPSQQ